MNDDLKKKVAFLDFDQTLWKGYSALQLLEALEDKKVISDVGLTQLSNIDEQHAKGDIDYSILCFRFGVIWQETFKGLSVDSVAEVAEELVTNNYFDRILYDSEELVDLLNNSGYETIIMSLAPSEVLDLVGQKLGVDRVFGARLESDNGIYTGHMLTQLHFRGGTKELHFRGGKKDCISKLKLLDKYDWDNSMAFGDSANDVGMLLEVDIPVAVNPNYALKAIAKKHNWPVFYHGTGLIEGVRELLHR